MGFAVPDKVIQGQILNFLIQIVSDTEGFDKQITFSEDTNIGYI